MATNILNSLMEKASNWAKLGQDENKKKKSPKSKAPKTYGEGYDDPTEETTEANLKGVKQREKRRLGKIAAENVASYTRQGSDEGDFALGKGRYAPTRRIRKARA